MIEVPISVFKKGTPENRLWGNKNLVMKCANFVYSKMLMTEQIFFLKQHLCFLQNIHYWQKKMLKPKK